MEANKILSADWLDLLFDDRNKAYGAYQLRKTYSRRIVKALLITGGITVLVFAGTVLANSLRSEAEAKLMVKGYDLEKIPDDPKPKPLPEPVKKPEPVAVHTEKLTTPVIVDHIDEPPPTQEELNGAKIGLIKQIGIDDPPIDMPVTDKKGIIEAPQYDEPKTPFTKVEVEAKFTGDWERFLRKYLNASVPVDNGAPAGRYQVIVQFVVDVDGSVSNIEPLTNMGYGMEQEAIRVLKKAARWEPAIQNGKQVKAYRKQPITFEVLAE